MTFSRLPVTLQESSREVAKVSLTTQRTAPHTRSCPTSLETLLSRKSFLLSRLGLLLNDGTLAKTKISCQTEHF